MLVQFRNRRGRVLAIVLLAAANVALGVTTARAAERRSERSHTPLICLRSGCACQGSGAGAICIEGGVTGVSCSRDEDCMSSLHHVAKASQIE